MSLAHHNIFELPPAPFRNFLCSLLPDCQFHVPCFLHYFRPCSLLHAPFGLKGHSPCSLNTPNGGLSVFLSFCLSLSFSRLTSTSNCFNDIKCEKIILTSFNCFFFKVVREMHQARTSQQGQTSSGSGGRRGRRSRSADQHTRGVRGECSKVKQVQGREVVGHAGQISMLGGSQVSAVRSTKCRVGRSERS